MEVTLPFEDATCQGRIREGTERVVNVVNIGGILVRKCADGTHCHVQCIYATKKERSHRESSMGQSAVQAERPEPESPVPT